MAGMGDDIRAAIMQILEEHAGLRQNGKVAANKTSKRTKEVIFNFFNRLYELGYKVRNPANIGSRHIEAVIHHWWYERKLCPKTMEDYASKLRIFFGYLGKGNLVKDHRTYLPDVDPEMLVVRTVAVESKSWAANGVDLLAKIKEADRINRRLGLILRMQGAFGLRRKEVLLMRPCKSDCGDALRIYSGEGKGNRERQIPIETEVQRQVLSMVKGAIGKTERLGWPLTGRGKRATQEQNEKRYDNYMARLGIGRALTDVTGHGLRAQYAECKALLEGFVPPTMGGGKGQLDKDTLNVKLAQVSQVLGHNRLNVTAAYYGSFLWAPADQRPFDEVLAEAIEVLRTVGELKFPPPEHNADCGLLLEMLALDNIDLRRSEAYAIWKKVCARAGVEWTPPTENVRYQLYGASFDVTNSQKKAA